MDRQSQTDGQRERQIHAGTDRQADSETDTRRETKAERKTLRQPNIYGEGQKMKRNAAANKKK